MNAISFYTIFRTTRAWVNRINQQAKLKTSAQLKNRSMERLKLNFDNKALRSLPIDEEAGSRLRSVKGACFSLLEPTPVDNPSLVAASYDALKLLDLDRSAADYHEIAEYFSGNKILEGSQSAAHCYCGHQFGYFSGQLGDGCAMYLGEVLNKQDERWEIQLKGAGLTPYSRQADGRKVLRSSIREFLCSEHMHHLGVPTTRAGTCVTSDTKVVRDILYNGNAQLEKATIVLRIAPTFLRFGSFEIFKPVDPQTGREGPSVGRKDVLDQLLDYTISTFYSELWRETSDEEGRQSMLLQFYEEVCRRTARLVAKWQCIGWCHGVLNTDNMSIVGVTIDYGPYGFMDRFDPGYICNGSDDGGRYSYENQPEICRWNCVKLAEAIQMSLPLEKSKQSIKAFDEEYDKAYITGMREKLGLLTEQDTDMDLVTSFLNTMYETGCDFTNGFRALHLLKADSEGFQSSKAECTKALIDECSTVEQLLKSCVTSIPAGQLTMFLNMIQQNAHVAQAMGRQLNMIKKEMVKHKRREQLEKLSSDEKIANDNDLWSKWLDKYVERLSRDLHSPADVDTYNKKRLEIMNRSNPRIVLRNWMAQEVIEKAEEGDFSAVQELLEVLRDPYGERFDMEALKAPTSAEENTQVDDTVPLCNIRARYYQRPPDSALGLIVT